VRSLAAGRARDYADAMDLLDLIGRTPLVELHGLSHNPDVRLFAKLEGQNPSGSIKDRIVLRMLREARASGELEPGMTLVEASTGNTGIALAMIGRSMGHDVTVFVPENVFPEIGVLLGVYGATVHWTPAIAGVRGAMEAARRHVAATPGTFMPDQFASRYNLLAHYDTTGAEIAADLPEVDVLIAGLGTGGTLMGTGRRLKEARPSVKLVGVEPHPGSQVQGLRSLDDGYIPPILDLDLLDGKVLIHTPTAFRHAIEIVNTQGIFPGLSAGAVLYAAERFAQRLGRGNIVCIFADSGWKYYGTAIWDAASHEHDPADAEIHEQVIWW
jgi:[CysO sulfur-carrier protein]-thiocarboxylate-dependent cysteine synthase